MSIYCGINGIVRKSEPVIKVGNLYYSDGKNLISVSTACTHTGVVGIHNVTRKFLLPTDIIQKIVWRPIKYYINRTESTASQVENYGTVTISGNKITVYCNVPDNKLNVYGTFFAVFRNSSEYPLEYLIDKNWNRGSEIVISSFLINLNYTLSVQTGSNYPTGITGIWCLGNQVDPGSWSSSNGFYSDSATVSSLVTNHWGLKICAGNETSSWTRVTITIDSFLLNGISFPVSMEG